MNGKAQPARLNILLADDDRDDRYFFAKALKELDLNLSVKMLNDGEQLMNYLIEHEKKLPDILFLDLNMPRISGAECLTGIKNNPALKTLPVIIYSTSLYEDVADLLYQNGAHYYVRKTDFSDLKKVLCQVITRLRENNFSRPSDTEFIFTSAVA